MAQSGCIKQLWKPHIKPFGTHQCNHIIQYAHTNAFIKSKLAPMNPAKIKNENQFPIIQFESEFLSIEF